MDLTSEKSYSENVNIIIKSETLNSQSANMGFQKCKIRMWKCQYQFSKQKKKHLLKVTISIFKTANLGSESAKNGLSKVQNMVLKVLL